MLTEEQTVHEGMSVADSAASYAQTHSLAGHLVAVTLVQTPAAGPVEELTSQDWES